MVCCLNPHCPGNWDPQTERSNPVNPDSNQFCQHCGTPLILWLQGEKGRYHPKTVIGQGGLGRTYLAEQDDQTRTQCVLKQLLKAPETPGQNERAEDLFKREATGLKNLGLDNPQIPGFIDYFESTINHINYFFLVQQFIQGQTLAQEFHKEGIWDEAKVRVFLESILPVLKEVHHHMVMDEEDGKMKPATVIHRDIKPDNLMRRLDGTRHQGKIVLIDFGVSRNLQKKLTGLRQLTSAGTPGYLPPEQVQGHAYPSSDLYSLGVTCFYLLSGQDPSDLWVKNPLDPYGWTKQWKRYIPQDISPQLQHILDKLLQYNHEDRYQSAQEVLDALHTPLRPDPQRPKPPKGGETKRGDTKLAKESSIVPPLLILGILVVIGWVGVASSDRIFAFLRDRPPEKATEQGGTGPSEVTTNPGTPPLTPTFPVQSFSYTSARVSAAGDISPYDATGQRYTETALNLPAGAVPLEMVAIEGGTFTMGSPDTEVNRASDEGPQHEVTVPDFFMGQYEVTQAQYEAVMGNNPANFKGDNNPIENVSWDDAEEFIQRLNSLTGKTYRLPTEAEWEYAARAGTTTPFSYGETITPEVVNYNGNFPYGRALKGEYRQRTIAVDSLYPNPWGLYHIHGNVWEWVEDGWHDNYNGAPTDGTAWLSSNELRLLRGGSWDYLARDTRSANRFRNGRDVRVNDGGFRLVFSGRTP